MNSTTDAAEFDFEMPQATEKLKSNRTGLRSKGNAESMDLVIELLGKLNANQTDFATADSSALQQVQTELQKVCQVITSFLEYSTNLVNDEGKDLIHHVCIDFKTGHQFCKLSNLGALQAHELAVCT